MASGVLGSEDGDHSISSAWIGPDVFVGAEVDSEVGLTAGILVFVGEGVATAELQPAKMLTAKVIVSV
jgi:hypothetical protein